MIGMITTITIAIIGTITIGTIRTITIGMIGIIETKQCFISSGSEKSRRARPPSITMDSSFFLTPHSFRYIYLPKWREPIHSVNHLSLIRGKKGGCYACHKRETKDKKFV